MTKKKNAAPEGEENLQNPEQPQSELEALNEKYLRVLAEYDNYRKRSQKEHGALYAETQAATIAMFLPILDNLELAAAQNCGDEDFKKGVELILKQFQDVLEKFGVCEIENETFDPEVHNAVMHVEHETLPENAISQVLRKGYKLGDRVIRHTMVQVAN